MLALVPLFLAVLLLVPVALVPFSRRASLAVSRVALPLFGTYVTDENPRREGEIARMRAAHVGGTHRVYASRTLFLSALFGVIGSVLGVYAVGGILQLLSVNADAIHRALPPSIAFLANLATLSHIGAIELFVLLLFSGATLGTTLLVGTYWTRWAYLDHLADVRAGEIDASVPRMVAFIYALSRSGMAFPTVLETLTRNQAVYGEAATEVGVAVRDMNAFGTDVLSALRRMSSRTPSENLEEFAENLASVLASGRSLSEFLRGQYERYQQEAEALQQQYLDLLSTFAEIYVTTLVAGPLFFITVLVVIGLVIQDTMSLLRLFSYFGIPIGSAAFILYLDSTTHATGSPHPTDVSRYREADAVKTVQRGRRLNAGVPDGPTLSDGGAVSEAVARNARNYQRLEAYDRFAGIRRWIEHPVESVLRRPMATLVVTLPIAAIWFSLRVGSFGVLASKAGAALQAPLSPGPGGLLSVVDQPLIEASMLVLGVAALVYELKKRRLNAIEDAVPDFLDRLASVNEAGLTVVESLRRVAGSDLGALTPEVQRARNDIEWGADAETALLRMERRAGTAMVTRAVTLITNAMAASGDVAPVLRIAASEAQDSRRLRRERKQEMFTYLLVIYISFLVFLGIVLALSVAFIPAIDHAGGQTMSVGGGVSSVGGMSGGVFSGLRQVNTAAYELLFFHVSIIQGVCSGLVAGQLGEGQLADGLKHATVLLALTYVVFVVV